MQALRSSAIVLAAALVAMSVPHVRAAELEKSSVHIAVGGKTLVAYLPLTLAERRGYFTKEGLQVTISDFQGGAKALEALVGVQKDKAPSYHTLRDLKGMKIGVTGPGSASAIGLKMLPSKAGMTVDDVGVIGV